MTRYANEPPLCRWELPDAARATEDQELIGIGADLAPGTMLAGYRSGLFPMGVRLPDGEEALGWWSPNPRGILRTRSVHVSRSLRRSLRHFEFSVDAAFDEVVAACADPSRPHGWIDGDFPNAYRALHDLGWAHSVEVWRLEGLGSRRLVGGLFGVEVGGLFAAESKFHRETDASKAAVVELCRRLSGAGRSPERIIDVQWATPHLETLGVTAVPRDQYLSLLGGALALDPGLHPDLEPETGTVG